MTESDVIDAPRRWPHVVRLLLFAAFLFGLFYLIAVARIVDIEHVRSTVAGAGAAAPLVYIVASAVLGAIFVPGPILAAGSGMLFGPVLGLFVTLGATVGTAVITSLIGRRAGRDSARVLLGADRAERLDQLIQRRGLWAVVGQRFIPGISDALASYAFGAFGVPLWQMAVGALIGSVPRAFVYTALGASIADLASPLAYAAVAVWCVTAIIGAFATHRGYRRWRAESDSLVECGLKPRFSSGSVYQVHTRRGKACRNDYVRVVTISYDEALREQIRTRLASHDRRAVTDPTKRHAAVAVVLVSSEVGEDRVDPAPVDDWIGGRTLPDARLDGRMQNVSGGAAFLLCRRASPFNSHAAQWALPGGRIDAGESALDAALRELEGGGRCRAVAE